MLDISVVSSLEDIEITKSLFVEYQGSLGIDLCFQDFETELKVLPGCYAQPGGRMFLARLDGEPAGCIGLRNMGNDICEIKRLYVRPECRTRGIGRALLEHAVSAARELGYRILRLDTLPSMTVAISLYKSFGFRETDSYYDNPIQGASYMELVL